MLLSGPLFNGTPSLESRSFTRLSTNYAGYPYIELDREAADCSRILYMLGSRADSDWSWTTFPEQTGLEITDGSDYIFLRCELQGLLERAWVDAHVLFRPNPDEPWAHKPLPPSTPPNVLVILIDAMASDAFTRLFPKTAQVLYDWDTSPAVPASLFDLAQLNTLGPYSVHNKFPLLANIFFPDGVTMMGRRPDLNWIWQEYEDAGYGTAFVEELCGVFDDRITFDQSVIVRYFPNVLTDSGIQQLFPQKFFCDSIMMPGVRDGNCFDRVFMSGGCYNPYCVGGSLLSSFVFKWVHDVASFFASQSRPWFTLAILQDAHSSFADELLWLDEHYANALASFTPYLENTIVVIMSDHGMHFGPDVKTPRGAYEHKNPLGKLMAPHSWLSANPGFESALTTNQHRLISHYDLYATFQHILHPAMPFESFVPSYAAGSLTRHPPTDELHGLSLLEPLPVRECDKMWGMPLEYCATMLDEWEEILGTPEGDAVLQTVIDASISALKEKTEPARGRCIVLPQPNSVHYLRRLTLHGGRGNAYLIEFQTSAAPTDRWGFPTWRLEIDILTGQDPVAVTFFQDVWPTYSANIWTKCRPWEAGVDPLYCNCARNHGVPALANAGSAIPTPFQITGKCYRNIPVTDHYCVEYDAWRRSEPAVEDPFSIVVKQ